MAVLGLSEQAKSVTFHAGEYHDFKENLTGLQKKTAPEKNPEAGCKFEIFSKNKIAPPTSKVNKKRFSANGNALPGPHLGDEEDGENHTACAAGRP